MPPTCEGATAVRLTREPGGTWLGERSAAFESTGPRRPTCWPTRCCSTPRRQLVRELIRPAVDAGETVVCARFADLTLAYQGYGAGLDVAMLRGLNDLATDGLRPDLTLLDVPVDAGLARKAPADVTRFEAEFDLAFHERVRQGFLAIAAAEPERVVVVDAARDIDDVSATSWDWCVRAPPR